MCELGEVRPLDQNAPEDEKKSGNLGSRTLPQLPFPRDLVLATSVLQMCAKRETTSSNCVDKVMPILSALC